MAPKARRGTPLPHPTLDDYIAMAVAANIARKGVGKPEPRPAGGKGGKGVAHQHQAEMMGLPHPMSVRPKPRPPGLIPDGQLMTTRVAADPVGSRGIDRGIASSSVAQEGGVRAIRRSIT